MKRLIKHLPHYIPLIGILIMGVVAFSFFSYDAYFQGAVAVSMAVSYVVWGIIHHYIHKDLYAPVVIEYILVASLGLIIILSLIFNT